MSRKGNPYDNAYAESFMKTLKYEEVLLREYETIDEATANIGHFIEMVYNSKRLHSSLGYRPPVEFEADSINLLNQKSSTLTTGMTVSF
jgi:transposase InsO family protein